MEPADYPDDPSIPDDAILWRRIPSYHVVYDHNIGCERPTSDAFVDSPDTPMSVALATRCKDVDEFLEGHAGFAVVSFTAGFARSLGQRVAADERPDQPAWHAFVIGKKTHSVRKKFAKNFTWVVAPPPRLPP
jgi:hypothetical protein